MTPGSAIGLATYCAMGPGENDISFGEKTLREVSIPNTYTHD